MVTIKVEDQNGIEHVVDGTPGVSLMETLRDLDIEISSVCGGTCACGTCHIFLKNDWAGKLTSRSNDEIDLLEILPFFDPVTSRLACQIHLEEDLDGLECKIAPSI